jgi:hypothetical protein
MNRQTRSHRKVIAVGLTGLVLGLMPPAGAPPAVADESIQAPRGQNTEHPRGEDNERPRGEDPAAPRGD